MSIKFVQFALDGVAGLNAGQRLTLVSLGEWANDDGVCWPSHDTIARRVGVGRRQVIRIIDQLEGMGLLERVERRQHSNTYRIRCDIAVSHVTTKTDVTSRAADVTPETADVTSETGRCDIAMSPEPSVNRQRTVKESSEGKPKKTFTAVPDSFEVTTDLYQWAAKELQMDRGLVDRETGKFLDHHRAKGSTMKDWGAAWKYWMRRSVEFRPAVRGEKVVETVQPFDPAKFQRLRVTGGAA